MKSETNDSNKEIIDWIQFNKRDRRSRVTESINQSINVTVSLHVCMQTIIMTHDESKQWFETSGKNNQRSRHHTNDDQKQ